MAEQDKPVEDQLADLQQTNKALTQELEAAKEDHAACESKLARLRDELAEERLVSKMLAEQLHVRCRFLRDECAKVQVLSETEIAGLAMIARQQVKAAIEQNQQAQPNQLGPRPDFAHH